MHEGYGAEGFWERRFHWESSGCGVFLFGEGFQAKEFFLETIQKV